MKYNSQLKSIFEENELIMDYLKFKKVEFVIYSLYMVVGEFDINSANLYFTQYFKKTFNKEIGSPILYMLRKRYHQYYSKSHVNMDFHEYFEVPSKYRFFELIENRIVKNSAIRYMVDRDEFYNELITKYTTNVSQEKEFLNGQGYYERIIRTGEGYKEGYKTKKFEFDLGEFNRVNEIVKLDEYIEKKNLHMPLDFNWTEFKKIFKGNWKDRPSIKISSCGDFDIDFQYKSNTHIVGLLGAGKSTYIIQESVRLLQENDIKIGIVEPNVTEVIKVYEKLAELGIRAVPIIGASQLTKHRERFINARFDNIHSFNNVVDDSNKALDYLYSYCKLSSYSNDTEIIPSQYPCNRLYKENESKTYNCSLVQECGHFRKHNQLNEAQVWITTPHSLLASKSNNINDNFSRTYYELFHDYLDIIFIDEADSVQAAFDDFFMSDEVFSGSENSIMKNFQRVEALLKNNQYGNIESETHRWIVNYSHLTQLINRIEYLIVSSPAYKDYLLEATITPRSILYSTLGHLMEPESENCASFIKCMESFLPLSEELKLNEELMSHELFTLYDKLSKAPNIGNASEIIDGLLSEFVDRFDLLLKKSKSIDVHKLFKKKLELYIYVVLIDYFFRIQNNTIDTISNKIPEIKSIYSSFRFYNKEFIHMLKESVIGNVFGYKFIVTDEKRLVLHLFNYSGIGRSLLEDWSNIKSELGQKGPAVVMLSGTSFAPESAHFHIDEKPTLILESEKKEGKIDQFILPKYDKKSNLIKISGISDQVMKRENLRIITKHLLNDIKYELKYWLEQGSNRKTMIIVNSYEQCRIVGNELRGNGLKYKVLSNNKLLLEDEINTSQIETVPVSDGIDVLIAPLSIISRGYNIIDEQGNSYFGSAFFLIRPYISPDDLKYNYRIINSVINPMVNRYLQQNFTLEETIIKVRKFTYGLLDKLNEKKFWKSLDSDQRTILSWYTFIPIKQTVGRMQRNGSSCRVFYCDGSFINDADGKLYTENSMLKAWEEILREVDKETGQLLYGEYLSGLANAIKEFEVTEDEEDIY